MAKIAVGDLGVDFSYTKPPPVILVAKGYKFVVGYLTEPPSDVGKRLLNPLDYVNAGLGVLFVWEQSATEANKGYDEGRRDGADARRDATLLGYPVELPILAACDTNTVASNAQQQVAYMRGFAETCGAMGIYGDVDILAATRPLWTIGWLPNAWSWSGTSRQNAIDRGRAIGVHVYQSTGFYIDGLYPVDPNRADMEFPVWGLAPTPVKESQVALVTNAESRQMPWGLQPAGAEFFAVDTWKRSVSKEEKDKLYPGITAIPLTNAALDVIPDAKTPSSGGAAYPTKLSGNLKSGGVIDGVLTV